MTEELSDLERYDQEVLEGRVEAVAYADMVTAERERASQRRLAWAGSSSREA